MHARWQVQTYVRKQAAQLIDMLVVDDCTLLKFQGPPSLMRDHLKPLIDIKSTGDASKREIYED